MKYLALLAITTAFVIAPTFSYSQKVGNAVKIINKVNARKNGPARNLSTRDPVFSSETITANADSHGEIRLDDKSRIIVGPGSTITLDGFLISPNGLKSGTINVAKGAFRFISSHTNKANIQVKTALATIGIRGTIFDVYVKSGGVTDVVLFAGEVEVCTSTGKCRLVKNNCDIVQVKSRRNIKFKNFLRSGEIKEENSDYNLITRQNRFPYSWRAPTAMCAHRAAIENKSGDAADNDAGIDAGPTVGGEYGE